MLVRDYKRKEAARLVIRIDPRVVSLVAELRAQERQAAEELGQWKTRVEERKIPRRLAARQSDRLARHGEPAQVFAANAAAFVEGMLDFS